MLDDNGVGLWAAAPRRRPPTATRWPVPTRSWLTWRPSPRWRPRCRRSTPAITRETAQTRAVILGSWARLAGRGLCRFAERRRPTLAELRPVQAQYPEQQQFWQTLSTALYHASVLELQLGKPDEALVSVREAVQMDGTPARQPARQPGVVREPGRSRPRPWPPPSRSRARRPTPCPGSSVPSHMPSPSWPRKKRTPPPSQPADGPAAPSQGRAGPAAPG